MKKAILFSLILSFIFLSCDRKKTEIVPPKLTNNPSYDVICTNTKPFLSFFNAKGGFGNKKYIVQLDTSKDFSSDDFIEYKNVKEDTKFVSSVRVKKPLKDKSRYYFRVKAVDDLRNTSDWSTTRFYIDTDSNKRFMNMSRIQIQNVRVSSGQNPKNIVDYDDPGQVSFWQAAPPGPIKDEVIFDFGSIQKVSRIWMLSNPNTDDGWLEDFYFEKSADGSNYEIISDANFKNNDTFRNIINIRPTDARFIKLKIKKFRGVSPQINCLIFYAPKMPPIPNTPNGKYVLLIGDQMNGGTYTELAAHIETLNLGIKTLTIPHYEISLAMLNNLRNKPFAIIFSGNNADYPNLPMYEYNGVFEIIRNSNIPLLGICAGHQMLAFTYGYSFVRSMGWEALSAMEKLAQIKPIHIIKEDPIFKNIKNPFIAPEIHGWSVVQIPEDFELLAESTYIQAIRHKIKTIYGEQFHAEVQVPYNGGKNYLTNFLKIALQKTAD